MPKPLCKVGHGKVIGAIFENIYESGGVKVRKYAAEIVRNHTTKTGEVKRMNTYTEADLEDLVCVATDCAWLMRSFRKRQASPQANEAQG